MDIVVTILFITSLGYYFYTLIYLFRKLAIDGGYGIDSPGSIFRFAVNPLVLGQDQGQIPKGGMDGRRRRHEEVGI